MLCVSETIQIKKGQNLNTTCSELGLMIIPIIQIIHEDGTPRIFLVSIENCNKESLNNYM